MEGKSERRTSEGDNAPTSNARNNAGAVAADNSSKKKETRQADPGDEPLEKSGIRTREGKHMQQERTHRLGVVYSISDQDLKATACDLHNQNVKAYNLHNDTEEEQRSHIMEYVDDGAQRIQVAHPNLTSHPSVQPLPVASPAPARPPTLPGAYPRAGIDHRSSGVSVSMFTYYNTSDALEENSQAASDAVTSPPEVVDGTGLVEANLVADPQELDLEVAQPLDPSQATNTSHHQKKKSTISTQMCLLGTMVVFMLVVGLVILLTTKQQSKEEEEDVDTPLESWNPTAAPTLDFVMALLPQATRVDILRDTNTPQARAYEWLMNDPIVQEHTDPIVQEHTDARLLQRFALATFYYALGGQNWTYQGSETGGSMENHTLQQNSTRANGTRQRPPPKKDNNVTATTQAANFKWWLDYDSHECTWFIYGRRIETTMCPNDFETVQTLVLLRNGLVGTLPKELAFLTGLQILDLGMNGISGPVLPEFGLLSNLKVLELESNQLSGSIPSEIGLLSNSISRLGLIDNKLVGSIPAQVWALSNLRRLGLRRNQFTGTIHDDIGSLLPRLENIMLERNQFGGTFPSSLAKCTALRDTLVFSHNRFTGSIPTEFGLLTGVYGLLWSENDLSGRIPSELGLLYKNLKTLELQGNTGLVGPIPSQLGLLNLSNGGFHIGRTALSGTIPSELCKLGSKLQFDCSSILCGCHCNCSVV